MNEKFKDGVAVLHVASLLGESWSHTLACHVDQVSDVTCMNEQFKGGVAISHVASLLDGSCRTHC